MSILGAVSLRSEAAKVHAGYENFIYSSSKVSFLAFAEPVHVGPGIL